MPQAAPQRATKSASEVRNVAISFEGKLDAGEALSASPTVTEVTTSDLTFANQNVSTAELTINGKTVAAGKAVQFKVSGGTAGKTYTIRVSVGTDATPAQTLELDVKLDVIA